jgi:hypothetical protein
VVVRLVRDLDRPVHRLGLVILGQIHRHVLGRRNVALRRLKCRSRLAPFLFPPATRPVLRKPDPRPWRLPSTLVPLSRVRRRLSGRLAVTRCPLWWWFAGPRSMFGRSSDRL